MPFTPSILEEYANNYLVNKKNVSSPFMTIGYDTFEETKELIPAGLHMGDYSARPQFVNRSINRDFWILINEFYKLSNIPCLLNTSLNLHGEPMNYNIEDAIRTLSRSSLNYLVIPNNTIIYKISKKNLISNICKEIN